MSSSERAPNDELDLDEAVTVVPDVFWVVDLEADRAVYVSPGFSDQWQMPPEALFEDRWAWLERVHPQERDRVRTTVGALTDRDAQRSDVQEHWLTRTDGSIRWIQDRVFPIQHGGGGAGSWIHVATDVTAQKQTQLALDEALDHERAAQQRADDYTGLMDEMLLRVSHQVRTRLTSILGFTETLAGPKVTPAQSEAFLRRLATNAGQLEQMLADMLDLDRLNRHVLTARREPTDIQNLVHDVADGLEISRLRPAEIRAQPVICDVDTRQVARILEALLANALKHTPEGTHIWIDAFQDGGDLVLRIGDAGPGVPPDFRERVFEPFHGIPSTREHNPGLGLGLALVRRFVDLHGGSVSVVDRPEGGAQFEVRFPGAVIRASAEARTPQEHRTPLPRPLVLAIDDDPQLRNLVRRILQSEGISCVLAENGFEGLIAAREYRPDVILLDIAMPAISGTTVLKRLRADERTDTIAVVMLTAETSRTVRSEHLLLGATDYVTKPFAAPDLLASVHARLVESPPDASAQS